MPQNLNQSGKQIIVDMINEANTLTLTPAEVTFGTPEPNAPAAERNTDLLVTIDSVQSTIHYNRLDLAVLAQGAEFPEFAADEVGADIHSLLPAINTVLGIKLEAVDVQNAALDKSAGEWPRAVVIRATDASLCYFGQFSIDLVETASGT